MSYRCSKCFAENKIGAKFCSECGMSFHEEVSKELKPFVYSEDVPKEFKPLAPDFILADNYKIIKKIKSGGMGSVYKTKSLKNNEIYAVKELINFSMDEQKQQEAIKRFKREANILSELRHSNLPSVIDYFSIGGRYYLVMDFIEGKDLSTILNDRGAGGLPEVEVVEWSKQICDVLSYLHSRNPQIIYRDIKPSNIMIRDSDNKAVLIDFGIARTLQTSEEISVTKTAIGTVGYMSPEQYRGKPEVRSDLYSLGATMYHLLTGNIPVPFTIPALNKERPDLSPEICSIIMTSIRLKSDERFKSAMEMKQALMGTLKLDLPGVRRLKSVTPVRHNEDLYAGLDAKKIISMAKGAKDTKIVEPLINILLADISEENRRAAASALGDLKDERAIDPLIMALTQEDEYVLINSIWSLGKLGDTRVVEPLFQLYECDSRKPVKNAAEKALLDMASRHQVREIVQFLIDLIAQNSTGYKEILPDDSDLYFGSIKELLIEFMKDPDRLKVRFHLGMIYYYEGALNDAILHLEKAHKLEKNQTMVLYFTGKIYHEKKDINKAVESYENALKLDPSYMDAQDALFNLYYECAKEYAQKEELNEEMNTYKKIISTFPNHPEIAFITGLMAMKQNNTKDAIKYFTRYIEENPQGNNAIDASQLLEVLPHTFYSKVFLKIKDLFNKKVL